MKDKVILITGGSDGIGAAAARILKAQGNQVVIVGRSLQKTEKVASELSVPYYMADFAKLDDVRKLAAQLKKDLPRIDVLANNAGGIMGGKRMLTIDGHEMTIQVNYLAPFLLTNLLLDTLIASKATVIATSSVGHTGAGKLDLDDIDMAHGYTRMSAYGKAKLMDILFTKELHRRYHAQGIAAAAFHPGVVRTSFASEFGGGGVSLVYGSFLNHLLLPPAKGADTLVWLATSEQGKDWQSGEYYQKRKIKEPSEQAQDAKLAHDLWELSAKLTGLNH
ncbi:MAG: SDR family NAD(P)-dependent oxidoreductase [Candidatus Methanomethylicaceae archaeon]|jgi:NAD(P)-dependent dehydrogenase (short-subunit alcohol dehydrogenase family)